MSNNVKEVILHINEPTKSRPQGSKNADMIIRSEILVVRRLVESHLFDEAEATLKQTNLLFAAWAADTAAAIKRQRGDA